MSGFSIPPSSLVARRNLWGAEQREAAARMCATIRARGLTQIRFSWPDQHGVLRGKTVMASSIDEFLFGGCGMASTMMLKDTSHRTVYPVWQKGGANVAGLSGAADFLIVADPLTFRELPWAPGTGWVLCDAFDPAGDPVFCSTRGIARRALDRLADKGYAYVAGLEIELHIFRIVDEHLSFSDSGQPGNPPEVGLNAHGFQYLTEHRYDQHAPMFERIREACEALRLPLRTMEVEFGPSQVELTFTPSRGIAIADDLMLLRTMVKQLCRRHGYHATFMCRPALPNIFSSGWHLHQSLARISDGANGFAPEEGSTAPLSPLGMGFAAGLLRHAEESCLLTTPTINGYKRYRPYSLAPDRVLMGRDNRAAMLRVISAPGSSASRIENRVGESAANPYLYIASQILSGLDGIDSPGALPEVTEAPYETDAARLPINILEAIEAFDRSAFYREVLGEAFVDYLVHLKRAEVGRFFESVTDWEQKEYFDLF